MCVCVWMFCGLSCQLLIVFLKKYVFSTLSISTCNIATVTAAAAAVSVSMPMWYHNVMLQTFDGLWIMIRAIIYWSVFPGFGAVCCCRCVSSSFDLCIVARSWNITRYLVGAYRKCAHRCTDVFSFPHSPFFHCFLIYVYNRITNFYDDSRTCMHVCVCECEFVCLCGGASFTSLCQLQSITFGKIDK